MEGGDYYNGWERRLTLTVGNNPPYKLELLCYTSGSCNHCQQHLPGMLGYQCLALNFNVHCECIRNLAESLSIGWPDPATTRYPGGGLVPYGAHQLAAPSTQYHQHWYGTVPLPPLPQPLPTLPPPNYQGYGAATAVGFGAQIVTTIVSEVIRELIEALLGNVGG